MESKKNLLIFTLFFVVIFMFPTNLFSQNKKNKIKDLHIREAMFYEKLKGNEVQCKLCFRKCIIPEGERGFCRNRENKKGTLYNVVYAKPSAVHIDPIEKEPQLHMLLGSRILCIGTAGCNFRCKHCQNWTLSQRPIEKMSYIHELSPKKVVRMAVKKDIPTISFTYNEPTSFYKYVLDIAKIAKKNDINILWHSNGAMNPKPLKKLLKYTDAVTIDLKGFTEKFYRNVSSARLNPVLRNLKIIKESGVWLEIVNLIIPTLNDKKDNIKKMCRWIKNNLGSKTPIHFTRFMPSYKLKNLSPTPVKTLEKAYKIAKKVGLKYVTIGNVPGHQYNSTFCPRCEKRLIHRVGFQVMENNVKQGECEYCGKNIPGV